MELNKNYRIVYDTDNTILQFFEQREKQIFTKELDKETGKNKRISTPSGEFFEFTENFYYPNLKTALIGFLHKCTWGQENVKRILFELKKLEVLINKIK